MSRKKTEKTERQRERRRNISEALRGMIFPLIMLALTVSAVFVIMNYQNAPEEEEAVMIHGYTGDGSPVVLEANGDSYTGYERVSAMTGLPTVLGWYVHEWLWRNNTDDLGNKVSDVEAIYTSQDNELVRHLLKAYDISYIFVGSMEREKYGDRLNRDGLLSLGEVVYRDENYDTWIVRVQI